MPGVGGIGLGGALIGLAALIVWIVVLIWLAQRVLRFVGLRTGWGPLDPRNLLIAFALLTGAIHVGNYALDLLDRHISGATYEIPFGFPSAFLIGSVAIGVGIAGVHWYRKQKPGV